MGTVPLTAEPVVIDLGPTGRAVVVSSVAFLHETGQHCADVRHIISCRRGRSTAALQALNPARPGAMRSWPI